LLGGDFCGSLGAVVMNGSRKEKRKEKKKIPEVSQLASEETVWDVEASR